MGEGNTSKSHISLKNELLVLKGKEDIYYRGSVSCTLYVVQLHMLSVNGSKYNRRFQA